MTDQKVGAMTFFRELQDPLLADEVVGVLGTLGDTPSRPPVIVDPLLDDIRHAQDGESRGHELDRAVAMADGRAFVPRQ